MVYKEVMNDKLRERQMYQKTKPILYQCHHYFSTLHLTINHGHRSDPPLRKKTHFIQKRNNIFSLAQAKNLIEILLRVESVNC